jgi:pimeloyl-ACP methyl ester carboxylesterase
MLRTLLLGALACVLAGSAAAQTPGQQLAGPDRCHVGVYRLADGRMVDIAPSSTDPRLRWRTLDGRTGRLSLAEGKVVSTLGWTDDADGVTVEFGSCAEGRIAFAGQAGRRVPLTVQDTTFQGSGGTSLAGRLVLPAGDRAVPISVLVHGSEDYSGRDFYFEQRAWPSQGVGIFVYDKRGTGGSQGKYTQDFHVLAADAVAAAKEARRLAGRRLARLGLDGGNQGAWIAPLAATQTPVDYVIARFGMAESPLAEDKGELLLGLREKGYGPDVLAKAAEVADVTGKIMASKFQSGYAELEAIKARYGAEPWFKDMQGEFTGEMVKYNEAQIRAIGPQTDRGTSWEYDPLPDLRRLRPPLLWVLAAEDREAPVEGTRLRLTALAAEGRPITVIEFPRTDHGIREFEPAGKERRYTRYADGYYAAVLEFARTGKLAGKAYGSARRVTP